MENSIYTIITVWHFQYGHKVITVPSMGWVYYLKARFHFDKNQFADILLICGIAGATSQMLFMPILATAVGEEKLLRVGLFACCAHTFLYCIAWSSAVPYIASMFAFFTVFTTPCIGSIVSKQVGADEQGKAQGCISGIRSFASVLSPLAMTPLTALFLSERAPFPFPGFSIMCAGFASLIAFGQSFVMRAAPPISTLKASSSNYVQV
ncbi:hypothetical protein AMTR_s00001p00146610 [Amborella trichopoda]|uniref:Major facilitator superfamily (MFS) profile domain-containing protein n=1 Tax=Amborella trichopoda TaxID=13333 RepID=W1NLA5_AMBTC|nr:hypothetical protein AMTR_s00001p00146610 [Amborella trichopoda]